VNDAAILRNILVARPDSGLLQRREFVLSRHGGATETYSLDLRDHAVLPALVNAHDHLQLNGLPPLSVQTPYSNSYAWAAAFQPYFEDAAVKQALAVPGEVRHWHGALKNALCGATTVMHHDPAQPVFEDPEMIAVGLNSARSLPFHGGGRLNETQVARGAARLRAAHPGS